VYKNKNIKLYDDIVLRPDGERGTYIRLTYHDNPPGVVIIPRLPDNRFLILRLHRYAVSHDSWEFPRGGSRAGENLESSVSRELKEETGLEANNLEIIGRQNPDSAILMTSVCIVLAALDKNAVKKLKINKEEAILEAKFISLNGLIEMVGQGMITDGFTLSAMTFLHAKHLKIKK
jgi:ADP-ribose pyrophosphatase